jgi:hypothetical protein
VRLGSSGEGCKGMIVENAVRPRSERLEGLFELDDHGLILYSNLKTAGVNAKGRNFFTDVADFGNAADLRRRFDLFRVANTPAQSFQFTCNYSDGPMQVKILLARLLKDASRTFLLDLRPA